MPYVVAVVILSSAILIHEMGHLLVARATGIPVARFSIGLGPRLFTKRIGEIDYVLSTIPFGGYVLPKVEAEEDFFRIPVAKRIAFALGGPLANVLTVIAAFAVVNVLQSGISFNAVAVLPFRQSMLLFSQMVQFIPTLFQQPDQVSGVVGIVAQGGELVSEGLQGLLWLIAFLSANLAVLNLLPFPVFDGGQMLLTALEKVTPKVTAMRIPLAAVSWMVLIGLMTYVTILDIGRLV